MDGELALAARVRTAPFLFVGIYSSWARPIPGLVDLLRENPRLAPNALQVDRESFPKLIASWESEIQKTYKTKESDRKVTPRVLLFVDGQLVAWTDEVDLASLRTFVQSHTRAHQARP